MAKQLKPGDRVEWDAPQGKTGGRVKKKLTSRKRIKGHVATASKNDPQYLVESDKSGKRAAHKPSELRRRRKR
jgi:hypothetical protein